MPLPSLNIRGHGLAGAILAETTSAAGFRLRVHDTGLPSASRVAAGLFTPLTGQRLALSWAADDALPLLHRFYPALERSLGLRFFHPLPTLRLFQSPDQAADWAARPQPAFVSPATPPKPLTAPHGTVRIDGGGWLDIPALLNALRQRRIDRDEWGELPDADLRIDAIGAAAACHPLWHEAGWRNAHGDILTLRIPGLPSDAILNFGHFLLPLGNSLFRLGATYNWDRDNPAPSHAGREHLLAALRDWLPLPFELIAHHAGIRPVAHARVPIAGPHPDHPRDWIFNGFGSKGVLLAPWMAQRVTAHLLHGTPLPKETWAPRRITRQRDRCQSQASSVRSPTASSSLKIGGGGSFGAVPRFEAMAPPLSLPPPMGQTISSFSPSPKSPSTLANPLPPRYPAPIPALPRKKLPIGIQNFAKIREGDYYYVDKTPFACRLVEEGSYYFLSRPRRFGKSLFVDTLKELFEGNKALFKGLYAETHWDWSVKRPVIRISFGKTVTGDVKALDARIAEQLDANARDLGVPLAPHPDPAQRLDNLVRAAREKFGQRAVILVDEYDKPILDYIEDAALATQMRDTLSLFYSAIKELDPHLEFVLLTGVSKFSKVNLFSKLNNLKDITLDPRTSAICGYTEADIDTVFAPELEGLDRAKFRKWYNGCNWTGEAVYNPFDALLYFDLREYRSFWYETGSPSILLKVLRQRPTFLPDLNRALASYERLSQFEVGNIATEALLFQTGYLTIHHIESIDVQKYYLLGYPNQEVQTSLLKSLMLDWTPPVAGVTQATPRVHHLLVANDLDGLRDLLTGFYASIPHQWYTNNPIAQYEGYYASVFYAFFASLGLDIRVKESSNAGRLDMAVLFENRAYIFVFKLVDDAPEHQALPQILAKGYDQPHRAAGRDVHCVGIDFSRAKRNIVAWDIA